MDEAEDRAGNWPDVKMLKHLADHRTHRNDLLPLFQLPPELLVKIISLSIYVDLVNSIRVSHVAKLHSLAQVSVRFANIVKSSPPLWNILFSYNPSELPLILAKSKDASLDIYYGLGTPAPAILAFLDTVLRQSHRWHLVMLSDPELEFGQRLIEQLPTPRLRTLQIMHWAREPLEVHGEKLVGLHDLTLRGVFVDLGSSIPSGLRQLELRELQNGGRPSLTQILTVLRASPELNRLELGYDILDESQVNGIAAGSLELPYLLSLKLDLQWEMIQTILAYLRFPNCIDMVVNARPSSSPDTSTILPTHVISQARSIIAAEGEPTVMLTRMTAALAASPVSEALHILLPLPLKDQIRWIDTILESTQVPPHPIALEARFDPVLQPDVPIPPLPSHTYHIISLQLTGCGEGVASWLKLLSEPTEGEQLYWHLPNLEDLTLQIWWNDHAEALLTMARYRYGCDTQSDGGSIPSGPVKSDDQGGIADERYNDCKTLPLPTNSSKLPAPLKKLTVYAHPTISNEAAQELKSIIGRDKVSWERLSGITEL